MFDPDVVFAFAGVVGVVVVGVDFFFGACVFVDVVLFGVG